MSKAPDFPDQSPAAAAASKAQLAALDSQKAQLDSSLNMQNQLMPYLLSKLGLVRTFDDKGNVTGFKPRFGVDKQQSITQGLQDRELAALHGKLPVNSQLSQQLTQQEQQLRAQLAASLGPDYAATSSGQQALADFQQRKANIIDNSSRQEIMGITGALNTNQNTVDSTIQAAMGIPQSVLPATGMLGQNAAGYGSIVGMDNQLRSQQYQAEVQAQGGMFGGIGSLLGTAAGIALAPATGGTSLAATMGGSIGGGIGKLFGGGTDPLSDWGISP